MTTNLLSILFSNTNESSLLSRLKGIFTHTNDSTAFDEILSIQEDVLLFYKTIDDLKKNNDKSKTITLSTGREIRVSLK